jgi:HD-GYP domain-containing protein (c-di-GMP phosphodiesterase class II)
LIELGRGTYGEKFTGSTLSPGEGMSGRVIDSGKPYLCNDVKANSTFAIPELLGKANAIACAPLIAHELTIGALWIIRNSDITEGELRLLVGIADIAANAIQRITLYEQTERQLYRLIALHQIDMTITASLDLGITLNVLLSNVITQLGVDAASILLLTPHTQTLEYAAGTGFRTQNIERSQVRLGVGQAGTAALQRKIVALPDLSRTQDTFSRNLLLSDEKFISHYAAPLIAKGQIKGVLEIFTRKRLDPAQDWLDFFEILATQAAIAIDSATLFNNLQQANAELRLAYDATIEGWSRALDLRDKETEGHTQRVTEMTLRLATHMGLSDLEKLDVRRGALLHDIGKMGIPDTILLKPGPLTDEEWQIMRKHPSFAYEMLSPIEYLRSALDIPYCHHERWDGNGYPRGLKGEEIPLEARIFSVVDVFDALIVDRPYRLAWTKEKVFAHIQEQSGKAFDPAVVKIFMQTESK